MRPERWPIHPSLIQQVKDAKPDWASTTSFLNDVVSKGLLAIDTGITLAKPRATATTGSTSSPVLPLSNNNLNSSSLEEERDIDREPTNPRALGTNPRALGTNPRSTKTKVSKTIPPELHAHEDLILEFWNAKKPGSSKSQTAWDLLCRELIKIQDKTDDRTLRQQLELGINGRWAGISLRNFEQFGSDTPKKGEKKLGRIDQTMAELREIGFIP